MYAFYVLKSYFSMMMTFVRSKRVALKDICLVVLTVYFNNNNTNYSFSFEVCFFAEWIIFETMTS